MTRYQPDFLTPTDAGDLLGWLLHDVAWQTETISLFGQHRVVPRLVAWFGEKGLNYRYSGRCHSGAGWPEKLGDLRKRVAAELKETPNFLLLNRYRDGSDSMGWHRDDEAGIGACIASVSLGASRTFLLREEDAERSCSMMLEHGSLLVFDGRIRHALPKTKRRVGERINLTFRVIQ
jgi:alkylated DNA repair dioxygenase AlkB